MQDKRKHKRYEARWKTALAYNASDKKPIFHTLTHDLSVYGTAVQSNVDEKKESLLTLLLIPPTINGVAQKVIKLKAVVMSSRPFRNGFRLGLSFIHDTELEKLWAIIKSLEHLGQSLPSDPDLVHHPAAAPAPSAPLAPAPPPAAAAAPAGTGLSVLDMIKQRTASKLQSEEEIAATRLAQQQALYRRISEPLLAACNYFTELSEQLNQLKPAYPAPYVIPNIAEFRDLTWKDDAQADCTLRSGQPPEAEKTYDRASMVFTLANPAPLRVEKDALAAPRAEVAFAELGFRPRKETLRNAQGAPWGAAFILSSEIKVRLNFGCNDATGMLYLETVNLGRFGEMRYEFPPEALDRKLLDQLTLMMLGEANSVGKMIKRVA